MCFVPGVFNLCRMGTLLDTMLTAPAVAYVHDVRFGVFALRALDLHGNNKGGSKEPPRKESETMKSNLASNVSACSGQ